MSQEEILRSENAALKQEIGALRMSEERFRLIVETAYDACITMDTKGIVRSFNLQAEATFGWSRSEVIGQVLSEKIIPERDREAYNRGITQFLETGESAVLNRRIEMAAIHRDGHEFPVELRITPIQLGGSHVFSAFVHDITNRKVGEEKLRAFTARLEQSNRELQDFAFVASHDLQEPLRKVMSFGDLLKIKCGGALPAEGHDYLSRMINAVKRMQTLITDLLSYSQVITVVQPYTVVNLSRVAQDVVSDLEEPILSVQGRVEIENLPTIEAEPSQMYQLLQNLVSNAMKYHRDGTPPIVKISGRLLSEEEIPEGYDRDRGPCCCLSVADNGIGFDEKHLDRMFIIFKRLHGRASYTGSGIGLAICKKVADHHGGQITARSKPGEGATFVITLPTQQFNRKEAQ